MRAPKIFSSFNPVKEDRMATQTDLLQGEITEKPEAVELPVEELLNGFLRALADEAKAANPAPKAVQA